MSADSILVLDNVSKHFGGLCVVEDLSFSVRPNCCTGLIGPNGAGKTTVFNLITGVYPIDSGAHPARWGRYQPGTVAPAHSSWHRAQLSEYSLDAALERDRECDGRSALP